MKRIIALLLSLTFVVAATAQNRRGPGGYPGPGGPGGPGAPGPFAPRENPLVEYLSLTPTQQAAWETSQSELHVTMRALHDQERALADQLRDATDAATIGNLVLQIRSLAAQRDAAKDAADAKFAALLTADQQVKFAAFEAAAEFLRQRGPGGGPPRDR